MSAHPHPSLRLDIVRDRLWEVAKRTNAPLLDKLDARKILAQAGYAHPSLPPAGFAISLSSAWPGSLLRREHFDAATTYWILAAREAVRFECPRYFVGRELIEACENTAFDVGQMRLSEVLWPLGTMVFMLPLGTILTSSDEDLLYCGFALTGEGFSEVGGLQMAFKVDPSSPSVVFFGQARSGSCFGSIGEMSAAVVDVTSSTFDPGVGLAVKPIAPGVTESLLTGRVSTAAGDSRFLASMVALVVKLVLALNSSPELREDGRLVKPRKVSKGRVHEEEWSPNYLGRHFRIAPAERGTGGGSVRAHWRIGHFRRQHFGPGSTLVRTLWIRPVFVGA